MAVDLHGFLAVRRRRPGTGVELPGQRFAANVVGMGPNRVQHRLGTIHPQRNPRGIGIPGVLAESLHPVHHFAREPLSNQVVGENRIERGNMKLPLDCTSQSVATSRSTVTWSG